MFEPQRRNVNKLKSLFNDDDNIVILPYALSNSQSEVNLYSNQEGSGLASLLKRNLQHFKIPFELQEIVETLRFDDFYTKKMSNKTIDLIKIDIEGNELKVLKSLKVSLKYIKMLQFEFGGANIDARNYFQDFWYFFKDNKFDIFRITLLGLQKIKNYSEADEAFRTTNYLALNKSFFEF